jgi:hypothetical protein
MGDLTIDDGGETIPLGLVTGFDVHAIASFHG